jgi:DNA polymerase-1
MTARYLLIDGHSLTYRAFFALPPEMATASGQVTNAVFGFTSMLTYVLKDLRPDGVLVAFDRSEPTFRHEKEPAYKAQRESSPEILRQQVGLVREVLDVLGIPTVDAAGWEADDLIATAARKLAAQGAEAIIVTGDRDSYQLVQDPYIKVLYNKRGVSDYALYDEQGILERTGVTPAQYPQYAALRGDPSDNLPGVPGVGEKTAAKLITTYGGLDGIFAHLDQQTPKLRESLAAHEDRARANHELMLLRDDAPLEGVDLADLAAHPRPEEARRLFEFLEFRGLTDRLDEVMTDVFGTPLGAPSSADRASIEPVILTATSAPQIAKVLSSLAVLDVAGAWAGDPGRSELLGVAVVTDPVASEVTFVPAELLGHQAVAAALGAHQAVRGHDIKPLMRSLLALDVDLKGLQLDTAIAAYLIDPVDATYTVAHLVETFTEVAVPASQAPTDRLDLDGTGTDHSHTAAVAALAVHHLAGPIAQRLEAAGVAELYSTMENPLVRVLARMEHRGVAVDVSVLRGINAELTAEVTQLAAKLREIAGRADLNLNSPTQLRELLYTTRGLTPLKKTKTGFSTDAATLEKLRDQWPEFIEPLLRHREVEKLRGTYGEGLIAEIGPDQRIHATFHQTVARTGRLSSDRPNLHNIPVRSDAGRKFRTAFIPGDGCELLVADYNQIELRCIAHLAQDPGLIEAFRAGVDIHNATAARVFDVAPEAVTLEQRSKAKMVSYGLAYGMEAYGLAQRLSIGNDEASGILNAYFEAFPNVRAYMDRTIAEARDRGYTETLFGRRRPIPELSSPNFRVRQAGERQAMNAGIQGLAADIFKMALVKIDAALEQSGIQSRLILQVHDEVLVEVPPSERDSVGELVIGLMHDAASLDVPLEVNVAWGPNWAAAKG